MAGTFRGRSLRESELYRAQLAELIPEIERSDEVLSGLKWGLSENPERFFNIPDTKLWLAKTDYFPGAPRLRVWFSFDDRVVDLLSVERIDDFD